MHNISCWMEISPHKGSTLRKSRQSSCNYRILEITQWIHKICSLKITKPIIDTRKTIVKIITSQVAWCGPTQSVSISVPGPWIYNKPIIRDTHKKKLKKPHFLINIPEELLSLQFSSQSSGQRYAMALLAHFKPVTCKNLLKHRELESEHTASHWAWETNLQHNQNLRYKYTLWNPNCSQIDTGENISCPYPFSQFREEKIPLADMNQMWKSLHWVPEPAAHWNPCSYLFASTVTSQSVATKFKSENPCDTWISLQQQCIEHRNQISHPRLMNCSDAFLLVERMVHSFENFWVSSKQFPPMLLLPSPLRYKSSADLLPGQGEQAPLLVALLLLGSHIALHWPETAALTTQTRVSLPQKTFKVPISHSKSTV